ncbi:unnamed protein product [Nyctereutes procyonoides]|uniref:40S ribosomal protein SA n=1 Tax=Nyctereutes procyonoides TaxID=34880 RepID=A0A811YXE3_NYCPR|nr:unnamed protein product [Nyctereutes procyonoides]
MKEEDVLKFLAEGTHLGDKILDFQMEWYIYTRNSDAIYIINLKRTWEKLLLAAGILVIANPADVNVTSSRKTGWQVVLKFAAAPGATPTAGCFTPGTFTKQIQAVFQKPRLLPVIEVSYVNLPTIVLCNTDSPLHCVDIAIPCNSSVDLMWWMLAWEVLHMCYPISCGHPREVMPDFHFYRDPKDVEKGEQTAGEKALISYTATQPVVADWSEGFPTEDWRPSLPLKTATAQAQTTEWVRVTTEWS